MKGPIALLAFAVVICALCFSANAANQTKTPLSPQQKQEKALIQSDLIARGMSSTMTKYTTREDLVQNGMYSAAAERSLQERERKEKEINKANARDTQMLAQQALAQEELRKQSLAAQDFARQTRAKQAIVNQTSSSQAISSHAIADPAPAKQTVAQNAQRKKAEAPQEAEKARENSARAAASQRLARIAAERAETEALEEAERVRESTAKAEASRKRNMMIAADDRLTGGPGVTIDMIGCSGKNSFECFIGGKIYHQGDTVNGFRIQEMSASEVIFEKDGKMFARGLR